MEEEVLELKYCPTQHMIADVLTKALGKDRHQMLSKAMGLLPFDNLQSGSVEDRRD